MIKSNKIDFDWAKSNNLLNYVCGTKINEKQLRNIFLNLLGDCQFGKNNFRKKIVRQDVGGSQ
jgi:hypothetical protein